MATTIDVSAAAEVHPPPPEHLVLEPERRRDTVIEVIRAARQRLILSVFRCTDYLVVDELAEAASRKIRVEALLTPRAKGQEAKKLEELGTVLESAGVEVFRYHDPIVKYHAKYMVADDGPALVSSLNFTAKCFTNTCDFQLVTHDPAVIGSLKMLFENDCVDSDAPLPQQLSERLIIGPDRARAQYTALVEQAQQSIRLIDHKLADPQIINLIKQKKEAGVAIEVLGSGQLGGLRSHGKMLLIDETIAAIGSIALAPLTLDFRREVAVIIHDPVCVSQLNGFFQAVAAVNKTRPEPAEDSEEDDD